MSLLLAFMAPNPPPHLVRYVASFTAETKKKAKSKSKSGAR